ncbi:uncharacterized protein LOC111037974 [Myzus persicae]|uniref:uncharacterized protein LOC111037974 n=1 Tax=Myzus persicae TaxID=13164 RepID=UPI000B93167F|nr:uncharacterized protein LOC111037974 [Myzus persicae]
MKLSLVLALAVYISHSVADEISDYVNWRYDNDTIPEMLPRNMREKSDEEIGKAVYNAYSNQIRVVSEYSGHVYDPPFPLGYLKNECPVPNTHTYQSENDLIETNVEWKEANIRGSYYYSNTTYFDQGNYHIQLENLKYQANTPLSENTMKYPASVPKSSISYETVKASFSGNIKDVTNVNDLYNLKYFLEEVASQHIADSVAKSMQPNISIAVRQAIRPYIMFKNVSDPHFKGFTASTASGIQLVVDDVFTNGLNQTNQRVKNMVADMANKKLISTTELVMHYLSGTFRMQLTRDSKQYTGYVMFEIENINVVPTINMFNRDECTANTNIKNVRVKVDPAEFNLSKDDEVEVNSVVVDEFIKTLKKKFNNTVCIALGDMLNSKAGNY